MKLKLKREELTTLINSMNRTDLVHFSDRNFALIVEFLLKEFVTKLMKKAIDMEEKNSISIDNATLVALNCFLPKLIFDDPYEIAVMGVVITKINQECLNF